MPRTFEVVTPENVTIRYELAGFGSRGVAAVVDTLAQLLIFALLLGAVGLLVWLEVLPPWEELADALESALLGLIILVSAAIFWGYYILFEALWNGETPGKRWLGLRVIKDDGYPVDFRAVLIRNLIRPADALPALPLIPSYGLAFVAVLLNPHYKRLGDMAAGTLVVRHGQEEGVSPGGFGRAEVYRLLDAAVLSQLSRLTREECRTVQRYLERRGELPLFLRAEFARRLAQPLIEKFAYHVPDFGMDYERWLEELDLAYRNRALGTAPVAATPPLPETAAPSDARKW